MEQSPDVEFKGGVAGPDSRHVAASPFWTYSVQFLISCDDESAVIFIRPLIRMPIISVPQRDSATAGNTEETQTNPIRKNGFKGDAIPAAQTGRIASSALFDARCRISKMTGAI